MKKIIPFNYFGGKFMHSDFIIKNLPEAISFCEVFGGSGIVTFNKKPSKIETFNDINDTVINFFEVLRNRPEELITAIYLTPYSNQEYINCFKTLKEGNSVERARKFYTVCNQSFNGTYSRQTGWKISTTKTNSNTSEAISRYLSKLPNLIYIVDRLKDIQISNYSYEVCFEKFDSKDTLFYCDPPYLHDKRCNNNEYEFEMNNSDHENFLKTCLNSKGKICISGYDNELYNDYLTKWNKITCKSKKIGLMHSSQKEVIWINYCLSKKIDLFSN